MKEKITLLDVREFILEQFEKIGVHEKKGLSKFHTINKYLIMAHSPGELKFLGNLIANRKASPFEEIVQNYRIHLNQVLKNEASVACHTNVLYKMYGYFKKELTREEKIIIINSIEDFKNKKSSLGEVLNLIKQYVYKFNNGYLLNQTYYLIYSDLE